jgi:hypothetical protein
LNKTQIAPSDRLNLGNERPNMKRLTLAATILAIAGMNIQTAKAGDREWATLGKVVTGVAVGALIINALDCEPAHCSVSYNYSAPPCLPPAPVVCAPSPVVYASAQVVCAPPRVVYAPRPVVVYRQPVYVAPPRSLIGVRVAHANHRHDRHERNHRW